MTMYSVYIINSISTGKYYIGYTSDLQDRLRRHNSGMNKSTKFGSPWKLVHEEFFDEKKDAWLRERQIKSYKGGEAFKKLIS